MAERLIRNKQVDLVITNIKSYYDYLMKLKNNGSSGLNGVEVFYICDFLQIIKFITSDDFNFKAPLIFFDEIFSVVNKNGVLNDDFLLFLSQCRKRGIVFITTVQEWAELNITLRRYCRFQVTCKMFTPRFLPFAIVKNIINDGDSIHWDGVANDWVCERLQTNFRKGLVETIKKYDTFETIKKTNSLLKNSR